MKYTVEEIEQTISQPNWLSVNRMTITDLCDIIHDLLGEYKRLREENTRIKEYHYGQEDCNGCCDRDHVINHLRTQLQAAEALAEKYRLEMLRCGKGWEDAEARAAQLEKYRQVIDDALVCWEMVTTGDALQDLNKLLVITQEVFIDPRVSKPAADLVAQVRRETAEACIKIGDEMYGGHYHWAWPISQLNKTIRARFGEEGDSTKCSRQNIDASDATND